MQEFIAEIKEVYKQMLMEEDFLSDETKALAVEKLDAMKLYALCPEKTRDYSSLDFSNRNFTEIMYAIEDYDNRKAASLADTAVDQELSAWDRMPTLEDNAFNNPFINAILFTVGIVEFCGYHDGMSLEEFYGTIGYVLAHEISHGFDENGSQITKDGIMEEWWKEDERKEFQRRVQKLIDYFDNITVFEGVNCNGKQVSAEATADITAVQAVLRLAKTKENFDYDLFFRTYAAQQRIFCDYDREMMIMGDDPHPLAYLRCNVVVQQFDEFLEIYDVHEEDGMYLAPEDRITVW